MLTDEMIKKSQTEHSYKGFTVIDDNYIVITGNESAIKWIKKTEYLRKCGVNYCGPVDYKIVDGVVYLLEHRAPGMAVDLQREYIVDGGTYLSEFMNYLANLRMINNAPMEQLVHFLDDIDKMREVELIPDVCSLSNLFYDPEIGFSFIDVHPGNGRLDVASIYKILINGRFSIGGVSLLPLEVAQEYNDLIASLYAKIAICLKKFGYPEDEIKDYLRKDIHNFAEEDIVPGNEIDEIYKERKANTGFVISL